MAGEASDERSRSVRRGNDGGTRVKGDRRNTGSPQRRAMMPKPETREGRAGLPGMADRSVRPSKPGNAGGGKGPEFKANARSGEGRQEIGL